MEVTEKQQVSAIETNGTSLAKEMEWFAMVLDVRLKLYFGQESPVQNIGEITPPDLSNDPSIYASIVNHYQMSFAERCVLQLSLIPHVKPELLDVFFTKNSNYDRGFTEFGGVRGQQHSGFLPTAETAIFLLAGGDTKQRLSLHFLFDNDHFFARHSILKLQSMSSDEPFLSGSLQLSHEYLSYFTTGIHHKPDFNANFPAKLITTKLEWEDLVLEEYVMEEIGEIKAWLDHGDTLMNDWGLEKSIKPGYRTLFYGPPGTGKTMTACLLGKTTGLDVYRVDLSMVISKYIGETEKNLANVFDQAENKKWILFFDEADALFGKRTQMSSSNDRHSNQEVSYLLQRIEDFPGVVILASNLKANIDEAFARRFQSMIYFPVPGFEQRLHLWQAAFSKQTELEERVDLEKIARDHKLTGGAIINIIRFCSLMALRRNSNVITNHDLLHGIRKEHRKEGKTG